MGNLAGVFHVHSNLSDGSMSLREIHDWAARERLDFVCIADHHADLGAGKRMRLFEECERLSGDVLLIPGIEFAHSGRHVIALAPAEYLLEATAEEVVTAPARVRDRGGMTIWAHPAVTYAVSLHGGITAGYDAWEVWNARSDGTLPNITLIGKCERASRQRRILPLVGWDMHSLPSVPVAPSIRLTASAHRLDPEAVVEALLAGAFAVESERLRIEDARCTASVSATRRMHDAVRYRATRTLCAAKAVAFRAKSRLLRHQR